MLDLSVDSLRETHKLEIFGSTIVLLRTLDWVIMLRDLNLTAGTGTKTADNIPKSSNVNAPFDQPLTFAMTA